MDIGLLILRLFLGGMILGHGSQKIFGAFGGLGPSGTAPLFEAWGIRPGRPLVILAGLTELIAGAMLVVGLLTPLAAAMVVGALIIAVSVRIENGLWEVRGGFELPLAYAVIAAVLGFTGPGAISLDRAFGLSDLWGAPSGIASLILGAVAAAVVIARARRHLSARPAGVP